MIEGYLYKKDSSKNQRAKILVFGKRYTLVIKNEILKKDKISSLGISTRLANTQREIIIDEEYIFITDENDEVDKLITKKRNILHLLESNLPIILLSLFITGLMTFAFIKWGIPSISKKLSSYVPYEINKSLSNNSLEMLDEYFLKKSKLPNEKKDELLTIFKNEIIPLINKKKNFEYKLGFRSWDLEKKSIANALALPNGNIIITDELIRISENKEELKAIIFHELAHIQYHHGMQRIIEGSLLAIAVVSIVGDANMLGDLGIGFGSLLINSNYSRNHEQEADIFAFNKMLKNNINPKYFISIMSKIDKNIDVKSEDEASNYLSSHPNTKKRLDIAKKYEECFNNKLSECDSFEIKN